MTFYIVLAIIVAWVGLLYLRFLSPIVVKYKLLHEDAKTPTKGYHKAACFDVYSVESHVIPSGQWREFDIGVAFAPWPHIYVQRLNITFTPFGNVAAKILTRSGHGIKRGLRAHLGVMDGDYRQSWTVCLFNHNMEHAVRIRAGEKVGQVEFYRVPGVWLVKTNKLPKSLRGERGMGSTGA